MQASRVLPQEGAREDEEQTERNKRQSISCAAVRTRRVKSMRPAHAEEQGPLHPPTRARRLASLHYLKYPAARCPRLVWSRRYGTQEDAGALIRDGGRINVEDKFRRQFLILNVQLAHLLTL